MGEARPIDLARHLPCTPRPQRCSRPAEMSGDINTLPSSSAGTRQRSCHAPERRYREGENLSGRKVATHNRTQHRRRAIANSGGNRPRLLAVGLRQGERYHEAERAGGHRCEIAERRGGSAISDLEVVEPVPLEMDSLERGIRAYDELLTFGNLKDCCVVSDAFCRAAPFCEQGSDNIEFLSRSECD